MQLLTKPGGILLQPPEPHPLSRLLPPMTEAEYAELRDSIAANSLRVPIALHRDGRILDGAHRAKACAETGTPIRTEIFPGDDRAALAFVLDLNLKRRHLNESQRAMVAVKLATLGEGRPGKTAAIEAVSQPQAAGLMNVSRASVQHAARVVKHGTPELVAAVEQGAVAVSAAANVATQSRARQLGRIQRERDKAAGRIQHSEGFYRTTPKATEMLLAKERFGPKIWECACGDGAISRVLEAHGHKVISTDLHERGYGEGGVDFLKSTKLLAPDIVTNAWFDLGDAFAIHALDLGVRKMALLAPLTWLEGAERRRLLWSRGKLARVWVFSPRLTLWRGDDEYAQPDGGMTAYAWFTFEHDRDGPPDRLDWLHDDD